MTTPLPELPVPVPTSPSRAPSTGTTDRPEALPRAPGGGGPPPPSGGRGGGSTPPAQRDRAVFPWDLQVTVEYIAASFAHARVHQWPYLSWPGALGAANWWLTAPWVLGPALSNALASVHVQIFYTQILDAQEQTALELQSELWRIDVNRKGAAKGRCTVSLTTPDGHTSELRSAKSSLPLATPKAVKNALDCVWELAATDCGALLRMASPHYLSRYALVLPVLSSSKAPISAEVGG